jgi:RimJ/RimL family protein N-acetyltransferase
MTGIRLRPVAASDLDTFFEHQRDPVALRVGALTSRGRPEFDTHWAKILADPLGVLRTVESEGAVAGYVTSFVREGMREVAYWYGREHWGKGIATAALREFLAEVRERPLFARVTVDHTASRRVLEKAGFFIEAREATVEGSGNEVEEFLLRLD